MNRMQVEIMPEGWPKKIHALVQGLRKMAFPTKVPVILQMSASECGAACLAMILSYFGRNTTLAECRAMMQSNRDGVSAQAIARLGRLLGLRVRAFSIDPPDFEHVSLPAIAHWNFQHFVVVERRAGKGFVIVDPAIGRRQVTESEFDRSFTGVTLVFERTANFHARGKTRGNAWLGYFLGILFRTPGLIAQVFLASILLQFVGVVSPLISQVLIDRVLPEQNFDVLGSLGIGLGLLVLAQLLLRHLRSMLLINLQTRLDTQLMLGFFEHLMRLPFAFFQQRSSGDLLMRLSSNAQIREVLSGQMFSLVLDVLLMGTYFVVLLSRSVELALVATAFGVAQAAIAIVTAGTQRNLAREVLATQADEQSYLVETLQGIATLKASGTEQRALDSWSNLFFKSLNTNLRVSHTVLWIDNLSWLVSTAAPLVLFWLGIRQVMNGTTTLGEMFTFNTLAMSFLMPLGSLVASYEQLQGVGARLERISDVLNAEPEQEPTTTVAATMLDGDIVFNNVSFRYNADGPLVLKDVSFVMRAGKKTAIVGRSGSGKSTLASLLLRLYQPSAGNITIGGVDLARLDVNSLRSQMGVVLQDSFLFSGSIRQNIKFGSPEIDADRVEYAGQMAAIHQDVLAMPMGYDTRVAEGGSAVSGGQRQRLSLARALAAGPNILIMDEATSHLDIETERQVEHNLASLDCTRVVIAHRLSTVRNADQIIVLDNGAIAAIGTHDELITMDGPYRDWIGAQQSPDAAIQAKVQELARLTIQSINRLRELSARASGPQK